MTRAFLYANLGTSNLFQSEGHFGSLEILTGQTNKTPQFLSQNRSNLQKKRSSNRIFLNFLNFIPCFLKKRSSLQINLGFHDFL